jgi:hypothetical protein
MDTYLSSSFWTSVGQYLLVGLCYCMIELFFELRSAKRYFTKRWDSRVVESNILRKRRVLEPSDPEYPTDLTTETEVLRFCLNASSSERIFNVTPNNDTFLPVPTVNKVSLSRSIGAWTLLWPFYALNLVIGRLLTEVWNILADMIVGTLRRIVLRTFQNAFKN